MKPLAPNGIPKSYIDNANIGCYRIAKGSSDNSTDAQGDDFRGSGVSGIHAALMVGSGKVVFTERWDIHGTKATLPNGKASWSTEYDYVTDVCIFIRVQGIIFVFLYYISSLLSLVFLQSFQIPTVFLVSALLVLILMFVVLINML
jgi:hypothetical protein